ncbi:MAG: YIP1 family protein [Neomegalonema sp.]|nr:YIP1 family protein [Neomegalonema sp.]
MSETPSPVAPQGLIARIRDAYWDFSGSIRRLLDERPREAILLSFAVTWGLLAFWLGGLISRQLAPGAPSTPDKQVLIETLITGLLVVPLGLYLLSALINGIARLCGGRGDWYRTRTAVIWALMIGLPITFVEVLLLEPGGQRLGLALFGPLTQAAPSGLPPQRLIADAVMLPTGLLRLYIFSAGIASAHVFSSPRKVMLWILAGMIGLGLVIFAASQLIGAPA